MRLKKSFLIIVILFLPFFVAAQLSDSAKTEQASIKKQLEELEYQIGQYEKVIEIKQKEKASLQKEIGIFDSEIKKTAAQIKLIDIEIQQFKSSIISTKKNIAITENDLNEKKVVISDIIRKIEEEERSPLLTALFLNGGLSHFFESAKELMILQKQMKESFNILKNIKIDLIKKQEILEDQLDQEEELQATEIVEKRNQENKKKDKDELLRKTKGKEAEYKKILTATKKEASTLKSQLFYLERNGISVDDAIAEAKIAANRVGIRPAYLLALLEVETGRRMADGNLSPGLYIGSGNWLTDMYSCYLNLGKKSQAENQKAAFFEITDKLHYDPSAMPVSRKPSYGCGGAIGPAQFLPSTWLIYENRVAAATGNNPPDPWKIRDAFTAAALFLTDLGANKKTESAEIRASRAYLSGNPNCDKLVCKIYSSNILSLTRTIERLL
ncbi:MAG: lytic murein transglycosylase [Parcubacteria group bacterium]|nr:lytic murein transglycosylase [Parcubacteria group bacterium]